MVLWSLLHLVSKVTFYYQISSLLLINHPSYSIKSRCFTMADEVDDDLALTFLSHLMSRSSPFYSFCSSHTKFAVLGIY